MAYPSHRSLLSYGLPPHVAFMYGASYLSGTPRTLPLPLREQSRRPRGRGILQSHPFGVLGCAYAVVASCHAGPPHEPRVMHEAHRAFDLPPDPRPLRAREARDPRSPHPP